MEAVSFSLPPPESKAEELRKKVSAKEIREILSNAPGVRVMDEPSKGVYPLPILAAGNDEVLVGRIRNDQSHPKAIDLWISSDNLRKGAALNAIQIAEHLL